MSSQAVEGTSDAKLCLEFCPMILSPGRCMKTLVLLISHHQRKQYHELGLINAMKYPKIEQ